MDRGRQTRLSVQELIELSNNPNGKFPKCLILNDLGDLCVYGNKFAEDALTKMLLQGPPQEKLIIFYFLKSTPDTEKVTQMTMDQFRKDKNNWPIVDEVVRQLGDK